MGTNTEALTAPPLLRLLQLSSSLLPIGAFAYSQGLEQAVELGWVNDAPSLVAWLGGIGEHALARLDLPVLRRAYAAWQRGDSTHALGLSALLLANREAAELVLQDEHLGNALCGVLHNLGIPQAAALYGQSPVSYVVAYALGADPSHDRAGTGPQSAASGLAAQIHRSGDISRERNRARDPVIVRLVVHAPHDGESIGSLGQPWQ